MSSDQSINTEKRDINTIINSLTQYSDENMMDAYNLAVCFGPSVIDIPPRGDAVTCQANINSVIKVLTILYIFEQSTIYSIIFKLSLSRHS